MTQLIITNVFNFSVPFNIWGCDIYGNNCILIATLNNFIPPTITLTLPPLHHATLTASAKPDKDFRPQY